MNLEYIYAAYGHHLSKMDVAAPVDFDYMFRNGVLQCESIAMQKWSADGDQGYFVNGNVEVESLEQSGHAIFITGHLHAKSIALHGTMVVLGEMKATEVIGSGEPGVLTVVGPVQINRAFMQNQYIMQFLGGGAIQELGDSEGGARELANILMNSGSNLKITRIRK